MEVGVELSPQSTIVGTGAITEVLATTWLEFAGEACPNKPSPGEQQTTSGKSNVIKIKARTNEEAPLIDLDHLINHIHSC